MNASEFKIIAVIIGMGLATYLTRAMGFWLAGRFRINKVLELWLGYLPGCILVSLVTPFVLTAGWIEITAAAVTGILMWRTHSLLLAMVSGIGIVAIGRLFI